MKKFKTKNTDEGIINSNGIIIDGDISLASASSLSKNRFMLIRTIIALVASVCTMYVLTPFADITPTAIFPIVTTIIGFAAIKSKNQLFRSVGATYLLVQTGYFVIFLSPSEIRTGFCGLLKNYLDHAGLNSTGLIEELGGLKGYEIGYSMEHVLMLTGFVIALLVSIACIIRFEFAILFVSTFPFFEIVIYHGWNPPILALLGLLICWLLTASISFINHCANKAGVSNVFAVHRRKQSFYFTSSALKERFFSVYLSTIGLLCCAVFIIAMIASALTGFVRPESFKQLRHDITNFVNDFSLDKVREMLTEGDGLFGIFDSKSQGGTNGGHLGNAEGIEFSDSTALHIKIQSLPKYTLYLKGYTGGKYDDNCWKKVDESLPKDIQDYFYDMNHTIQDFNYLMCRSKGLYEYENIISVSVVEASKRYAYAPYMTDFTTDRNSGNDKMDASYEDYVRQKSKKYQLEFTDMSAFGSDWLTSPGIVEALSNYSNSSTVMNRVYSEYVNSVYRDTYESEILDNAFREVLNTYYPRVSAGRYNKMLDYFDVSDAYISSYNGDMGDLTQLQNVVEAVKKYLAQFPYDLNPGKTPKDKDFIEYFLTTQKKGYCTYFATTGTMLMRKFGYAARYVEGYVVSPSEFVRDDEGRLSATVTDRAAHAWCEVFIDNIGWVPVEFTPGYSYNNNPNTPSDTTTTTTTMTTTTAPPNSTSSVTSSTPQSSAPAQTTTSASQSGTNSGDSSNSSKPGGIAVADVDDNDSGDDGGLGAIFGLIILYLSVAAALILLIFFRRKRILGKQKKLTSLKNRSDAVKYIYLYYLKYLSLIKIQNKSNVSDETQAHELIRQCRDNELNAITRDISSLSRLAVEAHMSNNPISTDEYSYALSALKKLSHDVVPGKLGAFGRFGAKWLYGMY